MAKPVLNLVGKSGNAYSVLAEVVVVAKQAGWSEDQIKKFHIEATSLDYDHLLRTCGKYFDVR